MSAILKQKLIDIANGFTKYGLWKGGGSGGSSTLSELTDVTLSNLQANDILKYNGSVWVNDDNLHEYSTEEKVIGKWIDGKPLYEKTFSSITIINNADNFVSDNFGNKVLRHFQIDFNGINNNLTSSNNYSDTLFINTNNQLMYYLSRSGTWWNGLNTANITIQYTKTMD